MESGMKNVFVILFLVTVFIYIVKNEEKICVRINKNIEKKLIVCISICIICLFGRGTIIEAKELISRYADVKTQIETKKEFNECDKKIDEEDRFYSKAISKKYNENYDKPYILDGFRFVEGTWDNGFVIEDENQNQYVWIPVSNKEEENFAKLVKKDNIVGQNICKENCYNDNYKAFIESALKYGGFYISRYEIGIENDNIVSKADKKLLVGLTKKEIENKIQSLYKSNQFHHELINSYAYDTTLEWLKKNNNIETFYFDNGSEELTGRHSTKNVYDFFDNIFEYTR